MTLSHVDMAAAKDARWPLSAALLAVLVTATLPDAAGQTIGCSSNRNCTIPRPTAPAPQPEYRSPQQRPIQIPEYRPPVRQIIPPSLLPKRRSNSSTYDDDLDQDGNDSRSNQRRPFVAPGSCDDSLSDDNPDCNQRPSRIAVPLDSPPKRANARPAPSTNWLPSDSVGGSGFKSGNPWASYCDTGAKSDPLVDMSCSLAKEWETASASEQRRSNSANSDGKTAFASPSSPGKAQTDWTGTNAGRNASSDANNENLRDLIREVVFKRFKCDAVDKVQLSPSDQILNQTRDDLIDMIGVQSRWRRQEVKADTVFRFVGLAHIFGAHVVICRQIQTAW